LLATEENNIGTYTQTLTGKFEGALQSHKSFCVKIVVVLWQKNKSAANQLFDAGSFEEWYFIQ
jgi:hypothetical protein